MPWVLSILMIGAGIAAAVSLASRTQRNKARDSWRAAADRLGFTMVGGGQRALAMTGTSGDLPVAVDVYQRGSSEEYTTHTRYRVELPPLGFDLEVARKTGWHGVLDLFGAKDVPIGDPQFDIAFRLTTSYEARALRYLNPQRVAALTRLAAQYPNLVLSNAELRLESPGIVADADRLVATVTAMVEAAGVLVVDESEAQYLLLGDRSPDIEAGRDGLQEIHDVIGRYTEGRTIDEPLADGPVESAAAPGPAVAAPSVSAGRVAADLFGDHQLGFESQRRFEELYQNAAVAWTGTVQREAGLSAARVFGHGDHTLVELTVATLEDELYGTFTVRAVVALPAGTPQPERGATVRFSGTLVAIDPLTKDLYVAEGRIE
jgi:hypothetical protein